MKSVLSAAVFLACASSLDAQILATLTRTPGGPPEVRVRNSATASLAAYAVAIKPSRKAEDRTQFVMFFDPLIDRTEPLSPDGERTIPVLLRTRPGEPVEDLFELPVSTAGLLDDGTTLGDPVLLTRFMLRRSNMLLAVETAMETLADAGRRNVPREQLIQQFRRLADSVWRWYVPPEQQVGRGLYQSLVEKLKALPEGPLGTPFPPSAFVMEETAALNKQRVALLESRPGLAKTALIRTR